MAAGTVISGGFPGRVAQEVQPNPKCNGCLHYDGQVGRTGACTIGLRPWNCGDGTAADIGYAPLVRGAGTYLPGMSNLGAHAPDVGVQESSDLYGAGSTRPVQFTQVSLGEEAVHFVKSLVTQHTQMQKSACRLCQSGGAIGTAPANVGPQICSCAPIEALTVAKALARRLSNRERTVIDMDDLVSFVYDVAKAGFRPLMKGTFYHAHGKYEVSPAGGGSHNVDFHPKGGGPAARVGTYGSHKEARSASETHARRFAAGTGSEHGAPMHSMANDSMVSMRKPKSAQTPPGLPSMKDAVSVAQKSDPPSMSPAPAKVERDMPRISYRTGKPEAAAKPSTPSAPSAPKTSTGPKVNVESVTRVPSAKPADAPIAGGYQPMSQTHPKVERDMPRVSYKSLDEIISDIEDIVKGDDAPQAAPHTGSTISRDRSRWRLTGPDHVSTMHATLSGAQKHAAAGASHYGAVRHIKDPGEAAKFHEQSEAAFRASRGIGKSLDDTLWELHEEEDVEKSLRWSRKDTGVASTSHGKYTVHHDATTGHHVVTYHPKGSDKGYQKKFSSHREALGAVVEHHLKNRPPPKQREKKPKQLTARAGAPAHCPPCP